MHVSVPNSVSCEKKTEQCSREYTSIKKVKIWEELTIITNTAWTLWLSIAKQFHVVAAVVAKI